jgi:hypothetical protein
MRRRACERIGERCISTSKASWQDLQSTHSRRGSGAPLGSLSAIGSNQIKPLQIEQCVGLYQRFLPPTSRLLATVTSFPGIIIAYLLSFPGACRYAAWTACSLSRYASSSNMIRLLYHILLASSCFLFSISIRWQVTKRVFMKHLCHCGGKLRLLLRPVQRSRGQWEERSMQSIFPPIGL